MAAAAIGTSWVVGSWTDTSWEDGSWADLGSAIGLLLMFSSASPPILALDVTGSLKAMKVGT